MPHQYKTSVAASAYIFRAGAGEELELTLALVSLSSVQDVICHLNAVQGSPSDREVFGDSETFGLSLRCERGGVGTDRCLGADSRSWSRFSTENCFTTATTSPSDLELQDGRQCTECS